MKYLLTITALLATVLMFAACKPETIEIERDITYTVDCNTTTVHLNTDAEFDALLEQFCDYAESGSTITFYNVGTRRAASLQTKEDSSYSTSIREEMKVWMRQMEAEGKTVTLNYDSETGTWRGTAYTTTPQTYADLIVGRWEVQSYYWWDHDITTETYAESTCSPSDSIYIGYDSIEFNSDGNSRWHMNDKWVHDGMYDNPYKTFEWRISGDTLLVSPNWVEDNISKYTIKELNNTNLVIENYWNNGHEEYSHHHLEQIERYTLKRANGLN